MPNYELVDETNTVVYKFKTGDMDCAYDLAKGWILSNLRPLPGHSPQLRFRRDNILTRTIFFDVPEEPGGWTRRFLRLKNVGYDEPEKTERRQYRHDGTAEQNRYENSL